MVQLALEWEGFEVWTASNGNDAVRIYENHRDRIALVLLDVKMPDLDGPCTLDALRELNPKLVACFMSGSTGQYTNADLIRRVPARIFAKPFRLDELTSELRSLNLHSAAGETADESGDCTRQKSASRHPTPLIARRLLK